MRLIFNKKGKMMNLRKLFLTCISALCALTLFSQNKKQVTAITPNQVKWITPPYYKDGRQRAKIYGDSGQDGLWVDRVYIPGGSVVLAHTHPHDELVTVIEGTWYLGEGEMFDSAKLQGYPAGSFIVIPAGVPHFVASKGGPVTIQLSGTSKFGSDYLEK
jgi:quercetin dioxygenase-like cupin family protein